MLSCLTEVDAFEECFVDFLILLKAFSQIQSFKRLLLLNFLSNSCDFMEQKPTVNKLINSWSSIDKLTRSILLIGPSHTGRTTFAELIKKYRYNDPNPNLTYDAAKNNYNLDGVISNRAIKIQTIYPGVYEKSKKDKEELKIVDVPSTILPPETKKWTTLEQRLTIQYMLARNTKVGFLIFIEEKNTRTNITAWKKVLLSFLDLFKADSFSDNLLNSIGMIITKAPNDMKEDTMVNRLKLMKAQLEKEKGVNPAIIDRLFKFIIEQNHILIFKKASGDDSEKENILGSYSQLENLANYTISKENIKEIPWPPEGEKALAEYVSTVEAGLMSLAELLKSLIALDEFTATKIRETKKALGSIPTQEVSISEEVQKKLSVQDKKGPNYYGFINQYLKLRQFPKSNEENVELFLVEIIKFNFFLDVEDQALFQLIFEGLQFRRTTEFKQQRLDDAFLALDQAIANSAVKALEKFSLAQRGNENRDFYEKATTTINAVFKQNIPPNLSLIQKNFKKKLIKFSNPKEAIDLYFKELKNEKDKEKRFQLVSDIGAILKDKGQIHTAGVVFKNARNVSEALICFKITAENDTRGASTYIKYLSEIGLYEQAMRNCYESSSKFGFEARKTFNELLAIIILARKANKISNVFDQNILDEEIKDIENLVRNELSKW